MVFKYNNYKNNSMLHYKMRVLVLRSPRYCSMTVTLSSMLRHNITKFKEIIF